MTDFKKMILFEDKDILVCHKKAGVPVQSARFGTMDMENGLKNYLAEKTPGKIPYLGLIHRLDQPVEGVVLFAKNPKAAAELTRQLTAGQIGKEYLALTDRPVEKESGEFADYLKKDAKTNTSQVVGKGTAGAKEARLSYRMQGKNEGKTLLKIFLDTGRHHQIRVQLSHHGMPILGDRKYGGSVWTEGLALCSCRLMFVHPRTGKKMDFQVRPVWTNDDFGV